MSITEYIENLKEQLPAANEFKGYYYPKDFIFQERYYHIKYYRATEDGTSFFWICNPNYLQSCLVNGSNKVME